MLWELISAASNHITPAASCPRIPPITVFTVFWLIRSLQFINQDTVLFTEDAATLFSLEIHAVKTIDPLLQRVPGLVFPRYSDSDTGNCRSGPLFLYSQSDTPDLPRSFLPAGTVWFWLICFFSFREAITDGFLPLSASRAAILSSYCLPVSNTLARES